MSKALPFYYPELTALAVDVNYTEVQGFAQPKARTIQQYHEYLVLKGPPMADQPPDFLRGQYAGKAPLLARPRQMLHVPFLAQGVLVKLAHR
jgi:hypothetical protein